MGNSNWRWAVLHIITVSTCPDCPLLLLLLHIPLYLQYNIYVITRLEVLQVILLIILYHCIGAIRALVECSLMPILTGRHLTARLSKKVLHTVRNSAIRNLVVIFRSSNCYSSLPHQLLWPFNIFRECSSETGKSRTVSQNVIVKSFLLHLNRSNVIIVFILVETTFRDISSNLYKPVQIDLPQCA